MEKITGHDTKELSVEKPKAMQVHKTLFQGRVYCGSHIWVFKNFVPLLWLPNELGTGTRVTSLMCPEHKYKHNLQCRVTKFVSKEIPSIFRFLLLLLSVEIATFWVVTRVVLKVERDKSEKHSAAFPLLPCRRRQYEPLPIILKKVMYLKYFVQRIYLHFLYVFRDKERFIS
jgi:hypothetical protein